MFNQKHNVSPGAIPQAHISDEALASTQNGIADGNGNSTSLATPEPVRQKRQKMDPTLAAAALEAIRRQDPDPLALEYKLEQLKSQSGYTMEALKTMYEQQGEKSKSESPAEIPDIEKLFSTPEKEAAEKLAAEPNLFDIFPQLVQEVGYITDKEHSDGMLLSLGLPLLPSVSYVCYYGDSSHGKTYAAETVNAFLDYNQHLGKVVAVLDHSQNWIKYAGGEDGRKLQNKRLFLDELNPARQGEDDYRQSLMRQMDSDQGEYVEFRIADRLTNGQMGERVLPLYKPVHFFYTSITPPHKWDLQSRNRGFYLEFNHDNISVMKVLKCIADQERMPGNKSGTPTATDEKRAFIFRSFNYFLEKYAGRIDPNDPKVFAGVKVPFLCELISETGNAVGSDIRRFKMLRNAIKVSALLHAGHRQVMPDSQGKRWLVASWQDFHNIKAAFERMVPRVTQPGGQAYLATFRKVVWFLHRCQLECDKVQLKNQCKLTKKETDSYLGDLADVNLLQIVRKTGDQRNYYKLSYDFQQLIQKEAVGRKLEADQSLVLKVAEEAIAKIEFNNTISSPAPPRPLADPPGEVKPAPVREEGQLPRSPEGVGVGEEIDSYLEEMINEALP